jgi:hypothetical protein
MCVQTKIMVAVNVDRLTTVNVLVYLGFDLLWQSKEWGGDIDVVPVRVGNGSGTTERQRRESYIF